jgi:serine/threonine protein kinase
MASTATATAATSASASVVVVEPAQFAEPVLRPATTRDCQVVDEQGKVRWVRCVVSSETGLAYCFVRSLRDCIYGVVRHGVTLEQRGGFYRYCLDRQVAIKCMSKRLIEQQRHRIREDPINELAALQLLAAPGHMHVQRLLECLEDAETVYSICPFYEGGELFSFIESRGTGLPEDQARALFLQIASGLQYMHDRRLCHRDLSLENILITNNDGVIIDMGMCLRVPADAEGRRVLIKKQGQCGKISYMSNEVFEDRDFDGARVC